MARVNKWDVTTSRMGHASWRKFLFVLGIICFVAGSMGCCVAAFYFTFMVWETFSLISILGLMILIMAASIN